MINTPYKSKEEILADNQEKEIETAFKTFDTDGSNTLDKHEFRFAFRSLGFEMSRTKTEKYYEHYECGDAMSYEDFARIARKMFSRETKAEQVDQTFKQFDYDEDGKIGVKDLLAAYHEVGKDTTSDVCEKLIKEFDEDGDGFLSYTEFHEVFFPTR